MNWKEKLGSTGFFISLVLLLGGLFVNFPAEQAKTVVVQLLSLISGAGMFRTFFKTAEFNPRAWLANSNTWQNIGVVAVAFFPMLTPEFFASLKSTVDAVSTGNLQGILVALFSLGTILWNIFKKQPVPAAQTNK